MQRQIQVVFIPQLLQAQQLANGTTVVVDVLRATTTIVSAIANGARQVIPTGTIPAALELRSKHPEPLILGGERGGVIIPGFDHGNSPLEFTPSVIADRTLVLCTTNGTVAMEHCRHCPRILIGAFVNLSAVAEMLMESDQQQILCSGTNGVITSEDVLFAGALTEKLIAADPSATLNDQAQIALGWWRDATQIMQRGTPLHQLLAQGAGGKNLMNLGYHQDIQFCARIDYFSHVPELDSTLWSIR